MPLKTETEVVAIKLHHLSVEVAESGENVQIYVKSLNDFVTGSVLCDIENPLYPVEEFLGQFLILDTKSIFCAGYTPFMHIHTYGEPVEIESIVAIIDKKTGEKETLKPKYAKAGQIVLCKMKLSTPVCIEKFDVLPALGRFTLREKKTIGFGKVIGVKPLNQVGTKSDKKKKTN
jgi:translation elongation factor EF-1alpha